MHLLRYTAIVASTTLLLATGVATSLSPDFYVFTTLRFVMGMTFFSFCFLFTVLGKLLIYGPYSFVNLLVFFSNGKCTSEVAQLSD